MKAKSALSMVLKALSCLALALVLSPPSVSHAQQSHHGSLLASDLEGSVSQDGAAHVDHAKTTQYTMPVPSGDEDSGSIQCCSGICLSVVLGSEIAIDAVSNLDAHDDIIEPRLFAFDLVEFLRPPKHLI